MEAITLLGNAVFEVGIGLVFGSAFVRNFRPVLRTVFFDAFPDGFGVSNHGRNHRAVGQTALFVFGNCVRPIGKDAAELNLVTVWLTAWLLEEHALCKIHRLEVVDVI